MKHFYHIIYFLFYLFFNLKKLTETIFCVYSGKNNILKYIYFVFFVWSSIFITKYLRLGNLHRGLFWIMVLELPEHGFSICLASGKGLIVHQLMVESRRLAAHVMNTRVKGNKRCQPCHVTTPSHGS
jgi:hypothetical protein